MGTIKGLYRKAQALDENTAIENAFVDSVDEYSTENKDQLNHGLDKSGSHLPKYRNAKYARVKNEMNPLPGLGNPDAKVTGDFTNSRRVTVSAGVIHTEYADRKAKWLLPKYPDISGLGGQYKTHFIETALRPNLMKELKKQVQL